MVSLVASCFLVGLLAGCAVQPRATAEHLIEVERVLEAIRPTDSWRKLGQIEKLLAANGLIAVGSRFGLSASLGSRTELAIFAEGGQRDSAVYRIEVTGVNSTQAEATALLNRIMIGFGFESFASSLGSQRQRVTFGGEETFRLIRLEPAEGGGFVANVLLEKCSAFVVKCGGA